MKQKKSVILLLAVITLLLVSVSPLVIAQEYPSDVEAAYTCFVNMISEDDCESQTTSQAAFNLMAAAYDYSIQTDCKSELESKKQDNCWGTTESASCDLKSTALAVLALRYIGKDVDDYVDWLKSKTKTKTGLTWYLEIDTYNESKCDINGKEVTIKDDKTIFGASPSGLKKAYGGYWFQIDKNSLDKNFTISCDQSFITTLIYKKPASSVYHISGTTHSADAGGSVTESVNSYCFSTTADCNYEGSLWAALALRHANEPIGSYIPYISAMADETENKKYFPSAFLYILTGADDYQSEIKGKQKQGKYWEESNKYYDTALALLALKNFEIDEVTSAKQYLLESREESGCWRSNTAFILHAGWPKQPGSGTGNGGGGDLPDCTTFSHYCTLPGDCPLESVLDNFYCTSSLSEVCCEVQPEQETCADKNGQVCDSGYECSETEIAAYDTNFCCRGDCIEDIQENECEDQGYLCQDECDSGQEEKTAFTNDCNYPGICCGGKIDTGGGVNLWLIIILIILIILVALAIIFRKKVRIWVFRIKSRFKSKKGHGRTHRPSTPPPGPPSGLLSTGRRPRYISPRPQPTHQRRRPPTRRSDPQKDKDFHETMKKLKDMSK